MASSKGQTALDLLIVLIVLFVGGITIIYGYKIFSDVNTDIQNDSSFTNESKASAQNTYENYASTWDGIFLMALILMWIFLLVSSFFIDSHPIFFVLTFILLIGVFLIVIMISNSYSDFTADADVATFANDFPIMNWVMEHLLTIAIIMGLSEAIALYAKNQL